MNTAASHSECQRCVACIAEGVRRAADRMLTRAHVPAGNATYRQTQQLKQGGLEQGCTARWGQCSAHTCFHPCGSGVQAWHWSGAF